MTDCTVKCPNCGSDVVFHRRTCNVCEESIGFPNVRKAESEQKELLKRYDTALVSIKTKKVEEVIRLFEKMIEKDSQVIIARPFTLVIELAMNDNLMLQTFSEQVAGNSRLAEDNKWDHARESVESALHPIYKNKIHYAALSLRDIGVEGYGNCHISLKLDYIKNRISFFEDNPFNFLAKHQHVTGNALPEGYRSTWNERAKLAVSKLHTKFEVDSKPSEFYKILIFDDNKGSDYIEAHIYGAIHSGVFEKLVFVNLGNKEIPIFNAYKKDLEEKGFKIRLE